jgi:hypothetical protein
MIKWLIKHLKKNSELTIKYRIAFCDTPDLSTEFGHDVMLFDTKSEAEAYICMAWHYAITEEINGAYHIDDAYLIAEQINVEEKR